MVLNQKCQNKVKSYLRSSTAASSSSSAAASATAKEEKKKSQGGWIKCAGAGTGEQNSQEPRKAPRVNVGGIHSVGKKSNKAEVVLTRCNFLAEFSCSLSLVFHAKPQKFHGHGVKSLALGSSTAPIL